MRRIGNPPSNSTGDLRQYLKDVGDAINAFPRFSTFSYSTPESNVTAQAPTMGMNEASGFSRLWAKISGSGNTGWTPIA